MPSALITIQGELRLPATFLQGRTMDELEQSLADYGLLPGEARERRWRMDSERPGGYVLQFTYAVPEEERRSEP